MDGEKDTYVDIKKKREEKKIIGNKKIDSKYIGDLVGNWSFDNWGACYLDLSDYDFSNVSIKDMTKLCFSTSTIFGDKLPSGYDPDEILKNSIRIDSSIKKMHEKGIDGTGVTVAVIDSGFQATKHVEFENSNLIKATVCEKEKIEYHYHMENVLSKLCGKNLGSAPKANVLYYETGMGEGEEYNKEIIDCFKDILCRIAKGENIKAISCSFSIEDSIYNEKYRKATKDLIDKLEKSGCFVVDSNRFGDNFFCCGTTFLNKDLDIDKYHLASFVKENFDCIKEKCNVLCSGLAVLEYCNNEGYKYEVVDCFSWTIPKLVGMYALCVQVKPNITFNEFVDACQKCSDINKDGINIININKTIEYLKKENKINKSVR